MLLSREITTKELPEVWNRLYREYLGIDVPDNRRGVLQDSHWSGGTLGYFPSYALGSAYGAQLLSRMREDVDVSGCLRRGDLAPVNDWLCRNIWVHGAMFEPAELLQRVLGAPFDPHYYTEYLENKFGFIYSV